MPLFLKAAPAKTGTMPSFTVAARIAWRISSSDSSCFSRYFSSSASSYSTAASISSWRSCSTFALRTSGTGPSVVVLPCVSSL